MAEPLTLTIPMIVVLLGLTTLVPELDGLTNLSDLFSGFSSNAVISIIAVMIIGAGLDKTGITGTLAAFILKHGGTTERRLTPLVSGTVAVISSFMQNVGAAALLLPVVSRISARSGLALSRLLMPMGFCAILGGTMTMIGSSPLILLNDLILSANRSLTAGHQMTTFGLFAVSPIGIALIAAGIVYFVMFGRFILPKTDTRGGESMDTMDYFRETYSVGFTMVEVEVPHGSTLIGRCLREFEGANQVRVIATREGHTLRIGAGTLDKEVAIAAHDILAVIGSEQALQAFVDEFGLERRDSLEAFSEPLNPGKAGIAEIVIPPRSNLIGQSAMSSWLRKIYGLALLGIHRGGSTLGYEHGLREIPFQAGDTLVVHTQWDSLALLTGAVGMVLSRVLSMEEAYLAVSWKTVFLLARLIPLGLATQVSGTAAWIAQQTLALIGDVGPLALQTVVAVLATAFSLVMSNVGATVLLVPLAVNLAVGIGADPAVFALTVAIATSNSFLIPTHQVNALIMGPAGYRVVDFLRAEGIMTVLFLVVSLVMLNLVF